MSTPLAPQPWLALPLFVTLGAGACAPDTPPRSVAISTAPEAPTRAAAPTAEPDAAAAPPSASDDAIEQAFAELETEEGDLELRAIPGCNELAGKDDCTGAGAVILGCHGLGNLLAPAAAERLVSCLSGLGGSEALCTMSALRRCGLEAIDGRPLDEELAPLCDELLARCPLPEDLARVVTRERCLSGLGALHPRPREDFIGCLRESCNLRLCLGGML